MVKYKLNWNLNGKTLNGHIYDKESLMSEFDRLLKNNTFFIYKDMESSIQGNLSSILAFVKSWKEDNGIVTFQAEIINPDTIKKFYPKLVTVCGIGYTEENVVVKNFVLKNLFLVWGDENAS